MNLKSKFPFRLGATSYILPADITPNIDYLADMVDDVELVIFEFDGRHPLPSSETVSYLENKSKTHGLSYTVHFPLRLELGHESENNRIRSVEQCIGILKRLETLQPFGYIMHCQRQFDANNAEAYERWMIALEASIDALLQAGLPARLLCLETLDYPFEIIERLVFRKGLSVCLDIGHLVLHNRPVEETVRRYWNYCRVIHLHGVNGTKDHCDISKLDEKLLRFMFSILKKPLEPDRVVTLEVFNEIDLKKSLSVLEQCAA